MRIGRSHVGCTRGTNGKRDLADGGFYRHTSGMDYDAEKVDEAVLALLWLTRFREKQDWPWRAWKGHDWEVLDRLHERDMISQPRNRNKSVGFTEAGERRAEELFNTLFGQSGKTDE